MFWIGYDAPDNAPWGGGWDGAGVLGEEMATRGGERLADTIDGLRAARDGSRPPDRDRAQLRLHDPRPRRPRPRVPADDLVLVGSPGVGGATDHASDLGLDPGHVWAGANSRDPIAHLGNHGWWHLESAWGGRASATTRPRTTSAPTGSRPSPPTRADNDGFALGDHSKYFDHDTESLYNIGQVVNGRYAAVREAGHVTDPWYSEPRDPEWDRDPTSPDTDGRP